MKHSVLVLAAIFLCAQYVAGQSITLKPAVQAGMSWTFDTTQDLSSDNRATVGGQTQPFTSKQSTRRAGVLQVLEAKNGEATKVKITFDDKCITTAEMAGQRQSMPFPLAGKSITITRGENGQVSTDLDGQLDPMTLAEAAGMIESDAAFFPSKPVAVGDEWPAEPKGLARQLQLQGQQDQAGATMKLLAVDPAKNTADVKVSLAVDRNMDGMVVRMITQGTAVIDIASGHILKLESKGTTTSNGTVTELGPDGTPMQIQISGNGTVTTSMTSTLKQGGAAAADRDPAPAPAPAPANDKGNPLARKSYAGTYSNGKLTLELADAADDGYSGSITLGESKFPATATVAGGGLQGTFTVGNDKYAFTVTIDGDAATLVSDGTTYNLKKQGPKNPLAR